MKTAEELNTLKEQVNTLSAKLRELIDEELSEVTGGVPLVGLKYQKIGGAFIYGREADDVR